VPRATPPLARYVLQSSLASIIGLVELLGQQW
jgi:hypothetical protein